MELVAQTRDIVPSTPAISTAWLNLDSKRYTGASKMYKSAKGVMIEQTRSASIEIGTDAVHDSLHQLITVITMLVKII